MSAVDPRPEPATREIDADADAEASAYGPGFWVALVVGWGLIAFGIVKVLQNGKGTEGVVRIGGWFAGGIVLHDLVIAPVVAVVGVVFARRVGARWWPPVAAGLAATAVVLLVAIPLLGGFGAKPNNNPSILPLDYDTAVLTVLGVVWGLVGVWLIVIAARARRAASG